MSEYDCWKIEGDSVLVFYHGKETCRFSIEGLLLEMGEWKDD